MSVEDKRSRRGHKSALTREIHEIDRLMAEDDASAVRARMPKLKCKFGEFEKAHLKYHDALGDDEDKIEESEEYFSKAHDAYVQSLTSFHKWLKQQPAEDSVRKSSDASASSENFVSRSEMMNIMHLPKVEIETFSGDPLRFHSFMAVFDEHVHQHTVSQKLKLARLLQYTDGKARDAIRACAVRDDDSGYDEAREILRRRFGNSYLICECIIKTAKSGKPARSPNELQDLADELTTALATLSSMKKLNEIDTQECIVEIANRLQPYIRNRWKREAMEMKRNRDVYPTFRDFVQFVTKEAGEATDPFYGNSVKHNANSKQSEKRSSASFSTKVENVSGFRKAFQACVLCKESHRLLYCDKFKAMKPAERLNLVKRQKLCENCLLSNHVTADCRKNTTCSVPGCGRRHTKYIHTSQVEGDSSRAMSSNDSGSSAQVAATANACNAKNVDVCVPLVSVVVGKEFATHALLDNASTNSFCTERLVDSLKLRGPDTKLTISTLSSSAESRASKLVDLEVRSKDGKKELKMSNVFVVKEIPVNIPVFDPLTYDHLSDVPFDTCGGVDILIGQDHSEALFPIRTKSGGRGEPFAVQTLLGWSINGPVSTGSATSKQVIAHFISAQTLDEKVQSMWDIENGDTSSDVSWSKDDKQVIKLWDDNVKIVEGKYELPVPWKPGCTVPNNISVAMSRLRSLKVSLAKRGLASRYNDEIMKLLHNGYAEVIPDDEISKSSNVWYLPHQAVLNDKKPDKVRVVFDCASKFGGQSLNDKSFQGPNLTNELLHVLLRFRQHEYAVTADIEAMYHQVRVPPSDRDMLRFLWYDDAGNLLHLRMTSHLFGGVWCSSIASYALKRVLQDNDVGELVSDTVSRSFYVDDCLRSEKTIDDAVEVALRTKEVLSEAGFRLTKFVANDESILSHIPVSERAKNSAQFLPDVSNRVLGIEWNVVDDMFYFKNDAVFHDPLSKRLILSIVSAIFDPLGLIAPITVVGRMIFQDVTRLKLSWDECVPLDVLQRWNAWIQSLVDLHFLRIPRCIKPRMFDDCIVQLHCFCDASLKAYGGCAYIRCVNKHGVIHTSLVMSKARVAPLKYHSVPRLELQGAVLVSKMASVLLRELDLPIVECFFWTDSQIVVKYIQNDSRRFHTFVANRVSMICELTDSQRWFFVEGKQNPADLLTRGEDPKSLDLDLWLRGPKFLRSYASDWSVSRVTPNLKSDDPEVRRDYVSRSLATRVGEHPLDTLISYHCSWYKLKRAVAWLLRVKARLVRKVRNFVSSNLTLNELQFAEVEIIKHVQAQRYNDEISRLLRGEHVHKSSSLRDLSPQMNCDGIMCVGGRLKNARITDSKKHPFIVPHDHHVARIIVNDLHNVAHLGVEWTLSMLRSKYWVTKARVLIKSVKSACVTCKKLYSAPCVQKMGDLPAERLEPGHPPFYFVGIDCFGPFQVKIGRSHVKRYGCLFTCMNTRAVHIEMLYSLETDSFLNGFRKFVSRRGIPGKVWSDNGLNFVGANNEIAKCMKELKVDQILNYSVKHGFEWIFNPPNAPHMGGIWERLVRTIKRILSALLVGVETKLCDEVLGTIFCEVEAIVNSRPITKVSDRNDDLAALTPSHLLLLREGPTAPPGVFKQSDMYKRRWRYVQHICNEFWKRWLKDYLTELQRRSKWHKVSENVKVGDLVLLLGENTPRCLWPMAIVTSVKVGDDGLVRSVSVRTRASELIRPIHKIVLLEQC